MDSKTPTDNKSAQQNPPSADAPAAPESSKRGIGYMWRIFIPTVIMVWLLMGGILYYQYRREVTFKEELVNLHLNIINNYVVNAYEREANMRPILAFLREYLENTLYSQVRLSIYDRTGHLLDFIGAPIPTELNGVDPATEYERNGRSLSYESGSDKLYYYTAARSHDGNLYVRAGMPYNVSLVDSMSIMSGWWIFVFCLGLLCTAIVYIATRMLTRNIKLLQDFATTAAAGGGISQIYEFPHDELGDISRQIVALYRSRTEAVSAREHEHRIALHAVEEKARIKNQLTNNINHELKTPIGIIKGYIDTILSDPDMPRATKRKFLERAQSNIDRLCLMLNDVSTMTRLEDGGKKIPVTEVDLHDLVFQMQSDFKQSDVNNGMEFNHTIPIGTRVRANSTVLNSLLSNLIRNAMIHSHGTEINFRLIDENDDFYIFSFADNGRGVPPDALPHLFERFYRVDSGRSRKAGGSGLGLPIVKNVIVVLGGSISVRNRTTGGLEFIFSIPKWKDE